MSLQRQSETSVQLSKNAMNRDVPARSVFYHHEVIASSNDGQWNVMYSTAACCCISKCYVTMANSAQAELLGFCAKNVASIEQLCKHRLDFGILRLSNREIYLYLVIWCETPCAPCCQWRLCSFQHHQADLHAYYTEVGSFLPELRSCHYTVTEWQL